jgi:hypothetical protein
MQECACNFNFRACASGQEISGRMATIVQSYRKDNTDPIMEYMSADKAIGPVVIAEDGMDAGIYKKWIEAAKRHNVGATILRTENLHEVHAYNNAVDHLMGMPADAWEYVSILQDDDAADVRDPWASRAIKLFELIPDLCVLGGYTGLGDGNTRTSSMNLSHFDLGKEFYGTEPSYNKHQQYPIPSVWGQERFMFSEGLAASPLILRRSCLEKIALSRGGLKNSEALNPKYGQVAKPGILYDVEVSWQAWKHGFSAGLYATKWRRGLGGHSTMLGGRPSKDREEAGVRNSQYLIDDFPDEMLAKIRERVKKNNHKLRELADLNCNSQVIAYPSSYFQGKPE